LIDAWQKVKYFLFIASLFVALLKKTSEFTHSDCQSAFFFHLLVYNAQLAAAVRVSLGICLLFLHRL
jgi:hypothetical protein